MKYNSGITERQQEVYSGIKRGNRKFVLQYKFASICLTRKMKEKVDRNRERGREEKFAFLFTSPNISSQIIKTM